MMPKLDPETWGKLIFGLYCLIGVPVTWRFMRQQDMTASSKQSGMNHVVVTILGMMWPVLLFAMCMNYLQGTGKPAKVLRSREKSDPKDEPGSGRSENGRSEPPPA